MGILGAIVGGVGSLIGSGMTSALSAREAQKNRDFQERMSSTSYQRSMADMRKAGLNPILAYQKGGASTPAGAQAQISDMSGAMSTALQASRVGDEMRRVRTGTQVNLAQVRHLDAQSGLLAAQTAATDQGRAFDYIGNKSRKELEGMMGTTARDMYRMGKRTADTTGKAAASKREEYRQRWGEFSRPQFDWPWTKPEDSYKRNQNRRK